jgi:serine/threonine protein phosphatase 1
MICKTLNLNTQQTLYIVSDIHGHFDIFFYALKMIGHKNEDVVVSVGDLVDRGTQNIEALNYFLHAENTHAVLGNHEFIAYKAFVESSQSAKYAVISHGGEWVMKQSDNLLKGMFKDVYAQFPYAIDIQYPNKRFGVCHAEVPVDDWLTIVESEALDKYTLNKMLEGRSKILTDHPVNIKNVDATFHGHTIYTDVIKQGNSHWIESGIYKANHDNEHGLTIAEINHTGKVIYHKFGIDDYDVSGFSHEVGHVDQL